LVLAITPATLAVTVYAPSAALAVNAEEVATPSAFVVSVSVAVAFEAKVPLAPVAGAVKVTDAPLTGAPPSFTVATSGAANAVVTTPLCGVPLVAAMLSVGALKWELLQLVREITKQKTKATPA
jgi:hypothetical protein